MDVSQGIIFGIIAMLGWGASDVFIAQSARGAGTLRAFLWSQIISVALLLLIFLEYYSVPVLSARVLGIVALAGFFGVIANLAFFKSLEVGKVSITMPVASCWAVVVVFLGIYFLGEKLTALQAYGVFFAIAGAVLVSFKLEDIRKMKMNIRSLARGVKYAAIAALAYGLSFVLIDMVVSEVGWFLSIFFIEIAMVFYLIVYSGYSKKNISFPDNVSTPILIVVVLDTAAYLAYGAGVASEYGSIVAPIGAASPAVGILMARIFFKERLQANHKIGIVAVLAGLVMLAV